MSYSNGSAAMYRETITPAATASTALTAITTPERRKPNRRTRIRPTSGSVVCTRVRRPSFSTSAGRSVYVAIHTITMPSAPITSSDSWSVVKADMISALMSRGKWSRPPNRMSTPLGPTSCSPWTRSGSSPATNRDAEIV